MLLHLHLLWHKVPVCTYFSGSDSTTMFFESVLKNYSNSHFSDIYAIIHEDQEVLI